MSVGTTGLRTAVNEARRALSRGLPVDVLAALDAVSKDSTRRTEDAWYLRAAALLMLGLPGESERVALSGARSFSGSVALPFVQSLARLALDDATGARTALEVALQRSPSEPLLLVQHAVISAREGSLVQAAAMLSDAIANGAVDSVVAYGREMLEFERSRALRGASSTADHGQHGPSATAPIELGLQLLDASRASNSSFASAPVAGADEIMDLFPTPHRGSVDAIGSDPRGVSASESARRDGSVRFVHPASPQPNMTPGAQRALTDSNDGSPGEASNVATLHPEGAKGRAVEIAAVLLIVGGAIAAAAGYAAAAVAFGVGVAWLAIRRAAADGSRGGRSR